MNEETNTSPKHPLHKFPGLITGDADELSGALSPFYGGPIVKPERDHTPFRAQLNICRLERMSLGFGASATALKIDTDENPYFLHEFLVRGSVEHKNNGVVVAETPYKGAAGEPGSLNLSYGPNFELFTVFMNHKSVSDVLSGLIGTPASRKIKLERAGYHERPEPPMMRGLVRLLISELDREDGHVSPVLLAEIQQAILVAYLSGVGHNYSHLLDAPNKTSVVAASQARGRVYRGELARAYFRRSARARDKRERSQSLPDLQGEPRLFADALCQTSSIEACEQTAGETGIRHVGYGCGFRMWVRQSGSLCIGL